MSNRHVPSKDFGVLGLGNVHNTLNAVPGFRTSAAFFTFLRANLVLPPSTLNSTSSTPTLDPSSSQTLPPLYPSSLASMSSAMDDELELPPPPNPLEGVPPLTTSILTDKDEKIAALKLVADSIAQQRQYASRAIIFHPITIAAYICLVAVVGRFFYKDSSDIGIMLTTVAGITMALLIGVRAATAEYIWAAEELKWDFLLNEDGEEDTILATKFGDEVMAAVVLRLERNGNGASGKKKQAKSAKTGGKGVIRAWVVRIRYRHKGVGTALLEEAVQVSREKLGNTAEIGFAAEHANSKLILPGLYNGGFKKREAMAARSLEKVIEELDGKKKR